MKWSGGSHCVDTAKKICSEMCKCLSLWNPLHCAGLCTLKLWQSNDSKQVTFSHRDLDSWVLISFSGCSNSSLTSAHLHNWIKTFARKLKYPLNCSLFHFNSSVDWFFFFLLSSDTSGPVFRTVRVRQHGFCIANYTQTCIAVHFEFTRL